MPITQTLPKMVGLDAYVSTSPTAPEAAVNPAVAELLALAEQGSAKAQFNLGLMYADGEGVSQNDAEAVNWYRKAAEQGLADAQYNLGVMYDNGRGVP